jgi:hypothetical protein
MLPDKFPSHAQMKDFMVSYLKELHPDAPDVSLHAQAELMVKETIPFIPVSHFFWAVWAILQVETSPVSFGFAVNKLGCYDKTLISLILALW